MEWLWLFLGLAGLGLLWLLIMGLEKLTQRLKAHDDARQRAVQHIAERTAEAESSLMQKQMIKAHARDFLENADIDESSPEDAAKLSAAMQTLSSEEFMQAVTRRAFGPALGTDGITATQSAFDRLHSQKVVAKGNGVTPVKVKSSGKAALSKSEQKMLKKIQQGD